MEAKSFEWDKLVRDRVPERIVAEGGKVEGDQLMDQSYINALVKKGLEEAQELAQAFDSEEFINEMADL